MQKTRLVQPGRQLDEAGDLAERTRAENLSDKIPEGHDDEERKHFLDLDDDRCEQRYLEDLQSKLLDRLAEVLARFKDEPKAIDAKHVASTILVLKKSQKKAKIMTLMKHKRYKYHVHAKIRTLQYHDLCVPPDEGSFTHPYIGFSKRCCWLCYSFILFHGQFRIRGTHESIMHRWGVSVQPTTGKSETLSRYEQTTSRLLQKIKLVLATILSLPYPLRGIELLAKSSAAISSAQITMEKESAQLERFSREL